MDPGITPGEVEDRVRQGGGEMKTDGALGERHGGADPWMTPG